MNNFVQHIDVELKIRHRVILPSSPIFMSLIKRMPEIVTIKHNHESTCSLPLWKKILASWLMSLPLLGQGTGSYSIHEGDSSRDQLMARLGWKRERERKLKSPSGSAYSPVHPPGIFRAIDSWVVISLVHKVHGTATSDGTATRSGEKYEIISYFLYIFQQLFSELFESPPSYLQTSVVYVLWKKIVFLANSLAPHGNLSYSLVCSMSRILEISNGLAVCQAILKLRAIQESWHMSNLSKRLALCHTLWKLELFIC